MEERLSTFETLRRREHGRRLSVLRQRLPVEGHDRAG